MKKTKYTTYTDSQVLEVLRYFRREGADRTMAKFGVTYNTLRNWTKKAKIAWSDKTKKHDWEWITREL